ncbi:MAG: WecB/TagA/CpsF family glycosyltransferase, partial [Candidatus Azambacteria bacterium]|nr:WecB/TagA/CpsF family glycosyltransferase [Candidatus Azambacteria bacterium]
MEILKVRIDNLSRSEISEKINTFLSENTFRQIATVNPEFILKAQKNLEFKNILNNCDLNVADGIGIWFAFLRFGKYLKSKIAGIDWMPKILKIADDRGLSVFLAARDDGLSTWEETRDAIHKIYPKLIINGTNVNCHSCESKNPVSNLFVSALDSRLRGNDNILFCNFGAPYQELFINSIKNDNIRLAMGVGGSFDFLTGHIKRAPKILRIL